MTTILMRRGTASQWAGVNPTLQSGEIGVETDTRKFKIGDGTSNWNSLRYSSAEDLDVYYVEANTAEVLPTNRTNVFVKFNNFGAQDEIVQTLPLISSLTNEIRVYIQNADPDTTKSVRITPTSSDTIDGSTEFEISGGGEIVEFISNSADDNWILAGLHRDASSISSNLEVDDGTTSVGSVSKINIEGARITDDGAGAITMKAGPDIGIQYGDYHLIENVKELNLFYPLEVNQGFIGPGQPSPGVATMGIKPGVYESQHAPGYYATLNDDVEVVGRKQTGVRTGILWFDNVIKPAGTYISIEKDNKAIGLQEDDTLDPNVTGGTAYLIHCRVALKGNALADGYVQLYLRDRTSEGIIEDWKGNPVAVRKEYKDGDELGALDVTFIKKYTGIEYFQICIEENFDGDELVIEDRTEGNSGIMVQALNSNDQTSRALLQLENDTGKNIEWTAHYMGADLFSLQFFLQYGRPLTTITPGTGETSADGWHLSNWTQIKVGIASNTLTIEDDGSNLVGFSFGNILSAEKTQLLRGKTVNAYATTTTPEGAAKVYAAKWTGAPDAYTKEVITGLDAGGTPEMAANWTLLGTYISFIRDVTGDPNTESGAFTVPTDAENFAVLFVPEEEQQPNKFEITDFHLDSATTFNGYFIHAPEEAGERHLIKDTKYFEAGLNTEGYASLRYTVNSADTPLAAGKLIKGKADITANWSQLGAAVDYLTFNESGDADISTSVLAYPGESIPVSGSATINLWWAKETAPDTWTKIAESERQWTIQKDTTGPISLALPEFTFKARSGDKLRFYGKSSIDDGAYIESVSPGQYLCKTTINFEEFIPGSEDEPVESLYIYEPSLGNDWELNVDTEGRLKTLEVGDLPEETVKHVTQGDFSGNDFDVTANIIALVEKETVTKYTEISTDTTLDNYRNYIVDTSAGSVNIDIDAEATYAFTVRDSEKTFDTNNCVIRIYDDSEPPVIAHTATLNKKDKGYIFYKDGTTWKYGEIGKGLIAEIASDHTASTDFGDLIEENDESTCIEIKGMSCYRDVSDMGSMDNDIAHKKYVDDVSKANTSGQCWVSPSGNDSNSGSLDYPFKTIQHALDLLTSKINLNFGSYVEDISIPVGYGEQGPVIWSENTHDSQKTEIQGTVTIPTGVSRLRCYGVQFDGVGTKECLIDNGSEGRHYFENCTFNNSGSADCVQINNGKRWFEFIRSVVDGKLNLTGTGTSCSVNIKHSTNSSNCTAVVNSGYSFTTVFIERMGRVTHHGGNFVGMYCASWTPDTNGYIVDSDSVSPLDLIMVAYSNLTADGITFGTVNSAGATVKEIYNVTS